MLNDTFTRELRIRMNRITIDRMLTETVTTLRVYYPRISTLKRLHSDAALRGNESTGSDTSDDSDD